MAIQPTTLYRTDDGTMFESETEAKAHDVILTKKATINSFLDAVGIPEKLENGRGNPRRAAALNLIAQWVAHQGG